MTQKQDNYDHAFALAVGESIREVRLQADFTQLELANRVGVSRTYINYFEHGRVKVSLEVFVAMCYELTVSPNAVLARTRYAIHDGWRGGNSKKPHVGG